MRSMRRLTMPPVLAGLLLVSTVACAGDDDAALDTLPPIRTTTTMSTTTTTVDTRRKFYEVKPGENLAMIAASFGVPPSEIVRINDLPDGGQVLQIGQLLEIPTDIVLVEDLPDPKASSTAP